MVEKIDEPPSDQLICSEDQSNQLLKQKDLYSAGYFMVATATLLSVIYATPFSLLGLLPMGWMLGRIEKVAKRLQHQERRRVHIDRIATALTEQLKAQGIEVIKQVPTQPERTLDLFIKFPTKEFFAISIKAPGPGKVIYNENNQTLCFRRKNKSLDKYDRPDVLTELKDFEWWLRKNRRDLFGKSANDAKRRLIKILVFAQPVEIRSHNDHLYDTINDKRFLCIPREKASVFVLSEDQVVDFIKAHITPV